MLEKYRKELSLLVRKLETESNNRTNSQVYELLSDILIEEAGVKVALAVMKRLPALD